MDPNYNNEIRDGPHNYVTLGPSESNDNIVQGAAEEPLAEGAISRPTSQASMQRGPHQAYTWNAHPGAP